MNVHIIEIKARCSDLEDARHKLLALGAEATGTDHQSDTYFKVQQGRLKLRRGNIENSLIHYQRENTAEPKHSDVSLYFPEDRDALRNVLLAALPVDVEVNKQREIYFLDNVKIHLDTVTPLGTFVEIEAIDRDGARSLDELKHQCDELMHQLGVSETDLLTHSYSDMIRALNE